MPTSHLAGSMSGIELAQFARERFPDLHVVITSGDLSAKLPRGATFMLKPWKSLDLLREAERSLQHWARQTIDPPRFQRYCMLSS